MRKTVSFLRSMSAQSQRPFRASPFPRRSKKERVVKPLWPRDKDIELRKAKFLETLILDGRLLD
jgi:hypothetical protein